jgi:hypothetical protein
MREYMLRIPSGDMIHVEECYVGEINLRLTLTSKQGNSMYSAGVRWAKDYEI